MAIRKIPMRKCIGCNEMKEKRELIRIVRNSEGEMNIDPVGKMPGRGAYICRDIKCLRRVRRSKRIDKSLEVSIPEEVWDRMEAELSEDGACDE